VPINQASAILPQLRETGRVSRGYIGVTLRDVDADLQRSLNLPSVNGALVQDITPDSPAARAGIRTYDVIVAVDGRPIDRNDSLIQLIAARNPGTSSILQILRDGRSMNVTVKLAERPRRDRQPPAGTTRPLPSNYRGSPIGLSVRDLDEESFAQFRLPEGLRGVVITRVEPLSPAFDAEIERGHVLLEINRQHVQTIEDYRRLTARAGPGDILTLYVYKPELSQRTLETVRLDER
jgi:serine protease Do